MRDSKFNWIFILLFSFYSFQGWSDATERKEKKDYFMAYTDFKKLIQWELVSPNNFKNVVAVWAKEDQRAWIDALWDLVEDEGPQNKYIAYLEHPMPEALPEIQLRYFTIIRKFVDPNYLDQNYLQSLESRLHKQKNKKKQHVNLEEIYLYFSFYEKEKSPEIGNLYVKLMKEFPRVYEEYKLSTRRSTLSVEEVRAVFDFNPDLSTYQQGQYVDAIRMYVFCRSNRDYPCHVLIKRPDGELHRSDEGLIWHGMALAASSKGLLSHQRDGQTPMGVQTMDSVMPEANFPDLFGKYRRVILNWVPNRTNFIQNRTDQKRRPEPAVQQLLPPSTHLSNWWRQSTLARDMGRVDLRIHGTGRPNLDPALPWFPFRKTSGCIAQREAMVDGHEYIDQRMLLDNLMAAMDLKVNYENEIQIKGLLYLMEVPGEGALNLEQLGTLLQIDL